MVLRDPHMGESMTQEALEDILAAHVDALLHGDDPTGALVAVYAAARDLLYLARRLYAVMVPVEPNARFVRQLKRELVGEPAGIALLAPRTWLRAPVQVPVSVKLVGALGGIALGAGLSLIALRPYLARLLARGAPAEPLTAHVALDR
ncbi:MAG: hypothetical protein Kow00120_27720 [Anaerolineae bacterium]